MKSGEIGGGDKVREESKECRSLKKFTNRVLIDSIIGSRLIG